MNSKIYNDTTLIPSKKINIMLFIIVILWISGCILFGFTTITFELGYEWMNCGYVVPPYIFILFTCIDTTVKIIVLSIFSRNLYRFNDTFFENSAESNNIHHLYQSNKLSILNVINVISTLILIPFGELLNILATFSFIDLICGLTILYLIDDNNNYLFNKLCCLCLKIHPKCFYMTTTCNQCKCLNKNDNNNHESMLNMLHQDGIIKSMNSETFNNNNNNDNDIVL